MRAAAIALAATIVGLFAWEPVHGAVVTLTDCTAPPVVVKGPRTVVDVGSNDLVIACQLTSLQPLGRIKVHAHDVTVQGPAGGIASDAVGNAVEIHADGALTLTNASLEAGNGNGAILLLAKTGFDIEHGVLVTGDADHGGRSIIIRCNGVLCPLTLTKSNLVGHVVKVKVLGPITAVGNTVVTRGPRDLIDVRSLKGDALLCCDEMSGHNEANFFASAFCQVNLTQSQVNVGENIKVTSGIGGGSCTTPTNTLLTDATLDNDFGKLGDITVTAANGTSGIAIDGATLIDDDVTHPGDLAKLNGCETLPRSGCPHVTGTAAVDE